MYKLENLLKKLFFLRWNDLLIRSSFAWNLRIINVVVDRIGAKRRGADLSGVVAIVIDAIYLQCLEKLILRTFRFPIYLTSQETKHIGRHIDYCNDTRKILYVKLTNVTRRERYCTSYWLMLRDEKSTVRHIDLCYETKKVLCVILTTVTRRDPS